ncbi:MAG: hypothetical protein LBV67_09585 [Streptococcaceae bacterium]|nr:hypothetical protein [Streptococcaceae bacterium]
MPKALLTDIHISLSNAQIPFYQILDSNKKILFQNTSNANFHKITQLSQYTVSLNELIEKNSSLMTKDQNFFIFI